MQTWPEYFQVRISSVRSNPIVQWGASFWYLTPEMLSPSSSCLPASYMFDRLPPQHSHLMAGILWMCQSFWNYGMISLSSSHIASMRNFPASARLHCRLQCLVLVLCAVFHLPLIGTGLNTTVACRAYSSDDRLHSFLYLPSSRDSPWRKHQRITQSWSNHRALTKLLHYLDGYMECHGNR